MSCMQDNNMKEQEQHSSELPNGECGKDDHDNRLRRYFAQFLATSIKNLIIFDIGMSLVFPGILIPALFGHQNEFNQNEVIKLTAAQASWLGK